MTQCKQNNKSLESKFQWFFVTTWLFTSEAIKLAKIWEIELIDYKKLVEDYYQTYTLEKFEEDFPPSEFNFYKPFQQEIPYPEESLDQESLEYYLKSVREFIAFEKFNWSDSKNGFVFADTTLKTFLERYKDWKKKDFSLFDRKYKIEMKKALEIWEA